MEEVAKTAVEDFKAVEEVLGKIKVENLPLIVEKLDQLELRPSCLLMLCDVVQR